MPYVAPGIYANIIDLSLYAPKLSTTVAGIVGTAQKGPMDTATFVSNMGQFIETFGQPISQGGYWADEFFKKGNQLWYVRVGDGSEAAADDTLVDRAGTPVNTLTIAAKSTGAWGNNISYKIADGTTSNTFKIVVYYDIIYNGNTFTKQVESWDNLSMIDANAQYCETIVNHETNGSEYITVTDLDSGTATPNDNPAVVSTATHLTGGLSGVTGTVAYVGTIAADGTRTGLQILAAVESLDLNLIAVPGVSDGAVVTEIIDVAETRADCIGLIDPPFGLGPSDVVDYSNGTGGHGTTSALNSKYAAMYYPWVKITDQYASQPNSTIWVCPSAFAAQRIAFTDLVAEPWFAPAGPYRGRIPHAQDVEQILTLGDKELMYGYPNAVNPIISEASFGISIDGQRTLQRESTALDRLNVMRMLLYGMKVISTASRYLKFEPNDAQTWRRFSRLVNPFLADIKFKRGLYDFRVQMDESTNTALLIDQNTMNGRLFLKPVKAAEIIELDFVVTDTGANFDDLLGQSF